MKYDAVVTFSSKLELDEDESEMLKKILHDIGMMDAEDTISLDEDETVFAKKLAEILRVGLRDARD